jgi:hypothetical protein
MHAEGQANAGVARVVAAAKAAAVLAVRNWRRSTLEDY